MAPLFLCDRGGEEVVGLISRSFRISEPAGRDKLWQYVELIQELGIEGAAALIGFQRPVAVCRRIERVPADEEFPFIGPVKSASVIFPLIAIPDFVGFFLPIFQKIYYDITIRACFSHVNMSARSIRKSSYIDFVFYDSLICSCSI